MPKTAPSYCTIVPAHRRGRRAHERSNINRPLLFASNSTHRQSAGLTPSVLAPIRAAHAHDPPLRQAPVDRRAGGAPSRHYLALPWNDSMRDTFNDLRPSRLLSLCSRHHRLPKILDRKYYQVAPSNGVAEKLLISARKRIVSDIIRQMRRTPSDRIVDVGVSDVTNDGANVLERTYPYQRNITACGLGEGRESPGGFSRSRLHTLDKAKCASTIR